MIQKDQYTMILMILFQSFKMWNFSLIFGRFNFLYLNCLFQYLKRATLFFHLNLCRLYKSLICVVNLGCLNSLINVKLLMIFFYHPKNMLLLFYSFLLVRRLRNIHFLVKFLLYGLTYFLWYLDRNFLFRHLNNSLIFIATTKY